ncbi:MAG: hypothetical protein M3Y05_01760 [Gemmatimonadota bacterium]|nr:hypothetical protein [Gemmatimonadota bacterium]
MKIKLIAIAAIALSPAVVFGQTRTHIRVTKDGSHTTSTSATNGDVTTTPAPTPTPVAEPAPAPAPEPTPAPTTSTTTTTTDSTNQYGTGAAAPTPTHSQQGDSAMTTTTSTTDSSSMRGMKMDSTSAAVDTVRVPRSPLQVSPLDSVRMGIPATKQIQALDSARAAKTP